MKPSIKYVFVLEPFRGQKAHLCQRIPNGREKRENTHKHTHTKQTHTHFSIYISRD